MIPFPFNENRFSFFVADHLLVGQLCTNPKSDRSLLSCLKVTQCSTSEIGDALLYNSSSLPIQVMTTGPMPAPSKFPAMVMVFGVAAGLGAGPQVQRDPGLASEGVLRLYTLLSLAPLLLWPEPAELLCLVIHREHHQHDLQKYQSQPDRHHPPSSHRHLWKRHAPSSGSISRRWLRLKVATLNRC